jgi:hypothetical protein
MCTPKGTPKGSPDLWSLPVAMILLLLYYYDNKKKKRECTSGHAQNITTQRKIISKIDLAGFSLCHLGMVETIVTIISLTPVLVQK